MKSLTKGNIKTAVNSVRRNKGRSILTMMGVIIGVTSVVTIVSIGEGVKHQVTAQINHLGKDLITVRPGQLLNETGTSTLGNLGPLANLNVGGSLSEKDARTVARTTGVDRSVALSIVGGGITAGEDDRQYNALVIGTTENFPKVINQKIAYGGFFADEDDNDNKVVIGSQIAEEVFNEKVPLGQVLAIRGQQFVVYGIFDDFETAPLSVDTDFNNAVFIPQDTARQITNNNAMIYEILARPKRADQTDVVVRQLQGRLLAQHGGQRDFTVLKQEQTLAVTNEILDLLTKLIGGVAAISLLVGGIGIMNIMLVSVTERMHEVGIRKAIGATNRQILAQFITESMVLSVSGGIIGIIISFVIEILLRLFSDLQPIITWQVVVIAFLVSVAIGVVFGSAPALKAARKDPIEALRNE